MFHMIAYFSYTSLYPGVRVKSGNPEEIHPLGNRRYMLAQYGRLLTSRPTLYENINTGIRNESTTVNSF